jgi:murein hydrolase activator
MKKPLHKYFRLSNTSHIMLTMMCISISIWWSLAQHSPEDLENQHHESLNKVKKTGKMLDNIRIHKQYNLTELRLIHEQILVKQKLIPLLEQEINQLEDDIHYSEKSAKNIQQKLQKLKDEYSTMVYATSKSSNIYNRLSFVLASNSINQAYLRMQYLKQYANARSKQIKQIQKTADALKGVFVKHSTAKSAKKALLNEQLEEIEKLKNLRQDKDNLYQFLGQKEEGLKKELADNQQYLANLEQLMLQVTNQPSSNKKENSGAKSVTVNKTILTKNFVAHKGTMPWPVSQGFIATTFGNQEHPVLKGVMIDNAGIDIQTPVNQVVRAVFQGQVLTVATIPGMGGKVIMIQHGDYFSVYAKVDNIQVSPGEWVSEKQDIATVFVDAHNVSQLQFQVWKGSAKLNPALWIKK